MIKDFYRETTVIGKEEIHEKFDKRIVGGHWDFAMDQFPGKKLFTGIKTCPYAHCIIKKVDTSKAEKMPGVKAVCTYLEVPDPAMPKPAAGKTESEITYQGMMVAAVAATDQWLADAAASAIEVEYEVLPFVVDMEEALKDEIKYRTDVKTNLTSRVQLNRGDVDEAMAKAEVTVNYESEYATFYSHNSPETRSATAQWVGDELWVWQGSQQIASHSTNIAKAMGIDEAKLHFIAHGMGGGYGDRKPNGEAAWIAATLAKKCGMPVGCRTTRTVHSTGAATHQYAQQANVQLGSDRQGNISAVDAQWKGNNGYIHLAMTSSHCPNIRTSYTNIATNIPRTGPFRSVTGMHGCFVSDPAFEELAYKLDMDPFDLRYKNAVNIDDIDAAANRPRGVTAMREVMDLANKEFGWKTKWHKAGTNVTVDDIYHNGDKRLHGVGMCHEVSEKGAGNAGRGVILRACPDGSFHINFGIGRATCGTSTAVAVVVAETLGTPFSKVNYTVGETILAGNGGMQAGSTGTNANSWAAYDAAVAMRDKMMAKAASTLKVDVSELTSADGKIFVTADPSKWVSHSDCIGSTPLITFGDGYTFSKNGDVQFFRDYGPFKEGTPAVTRTYCVQMVEVAVDVETGDMEVLNWYNVTDVGTALFPSGVLHQVEGAMCMQVGIIKAWEQLFDPATGATINGTFIDQKNATSADVPVSHMKAAYYESHNNSSPYGVMGCGEPPMIPYVAFHNAFFNATGKRVKFTTMNPARCLKALGTIDY